VIDAAVDPRAAQELNDAEVIRHSLREPESFAVLFERYGRRIHEYAARGLGTQAAEDIAAGRPGVAFARTNDLGERTSIILDPTTCAYLGTREDVARAHTWKPQNGKPFTTKPGTVLS
jgi:hypothetical protein